MRAKQVACCLLLLAMVVVSGCQEEKGLVGRWDMGSSNFYFRKDGVVFYTAASKTRYQGRYYYDASTDPKTVRAELKEMNGSQRQLTMDLLVTFLSPDRVRFDNRNGGRNPSILGARAQEDLASN